MEQWRVIFCVLFLSISLQSCETSVSARGSAMPNLELIAIVRRAADQGDAKAQYLLGLMHYAYGASMSLGQQRATEWLRKAANQGNADAQCLLGIMLYFEGKNMPPNTQQATRWLHKAADQKNNSARSFLNAMYKTPQNMRQTIDNLFEMAEEDDADTQFVLGMMYEYGLGGLPRNRQQAEMWYYRAAKQGHGNARKKLEWPCLNGRYTLHDVQQLVERRGCEDEFAPTWAYLLGKAYKDGGLGLRVDVEKGAYYFRKAAECNDPVAQGELGHMYATGRGVPKDERLADQWCRQAVGSLKFAAAQGNAAAQRNLGRMYENGRGVTQDDQLATQWYRKAAEQGDVSAQNNLGARYELGRGVPQDDRQAAKWYREAAKRGNAAGQINLGRMYESGRGERLSYQQAADWYHKAAEQGNDLAQYALGMMYADGRGVPQDSSQAMEWLCKAAAQGNDEARKFLLQMQRRQ